MRSMTLLDSLTLPPNTSPKTIATALRESSDQIHQLIEASGIGESPMLKGFRKILRQEKMTRRTYGANDDTK